ncbi:MAG: DEAD/DEAH box helicase [Bacteroidota bacterium]|nr:DEAD/DEAH box helicase [Bacteroidota bacterium]
MAFIDLKLKSPFQKALTDIGLTEPTVIQDKAFSVIMSGKDVLGIAQTGTGKTFAYLLPLLNQWEFDKNKNVQILIIVPTRELVVQVINEINKLSTYISLTAIGIYGGVNLQRHRDEISHGLDILVATPGRLLDVMLAGDIKTKTIKKLVIDEVDEMLGLGFRAQLTRIFDLLPPKRQNILFSATLVEEVKELTDKFFNNPTIIEAAPSGTPIEKIKQQAYKVPNFHTKINLLIFLLKNRNEMNKVLVFVNSKNMADTIFEIIQPEFESELLVIHSNKSQNNRFAAVDGFKNGNIRILLATDIIARGIDILGVSHVISFDIPEVAENYIHRTGRTGRANSEGNAISFVTEKELKNLNKIEKLMKKKIEMLDFPKSVEVSDIITLDETPKVEMKIIKLKERSNYEPGPSFHEKSEKNKKVNMHLTRAARMKLKYGKSKTMLGKKKR